MSDLIFKDVKEAFSLQSSGYDDYEMLHSTLKFMRSEVRNHVMNLLREGDRILEINAGTGTDAVFFAKNGFNVHATDISGGMIFQLKYKVAKFNLEDRVSVQQCSYTELNKVNCGPFDFIFSNFGGLNCLSDLQQVTKFFPNLLNRKARVTLVLMPPVCPWEIALIFRGQFKTAFRRLKKNGTRSHIEGRYFNTYYYSPRQTIESLGEKFRILKLQGLATFTPPPYMEKFREKFPSIYRNLNKFDKYFSNYFPFNHLADHFILSAEYLPEK